MGFSDYFIQTVTAPSEPQKTSTSTTNTTGNTDASDGKSGGSAQRSDQEILESIEDIYYQPESNAQMYELQVGRRELNEWVGVLCVCRPDKQPALASNVCHTKGKVYNKCDVGKQECNALSFTNQFTICRCICFVLFVFFLFILLVIIIYICTLSI